MTRALVRIGEFLRMESAAGIILIFAAAFALIASNSPFAVEYAGLFQQYLQVGFGEQAINKPILLWINDALMAIGFKGGVEMGAGASWGGRRVLCWRALSCQPVCR
ncbi:Na+/H+ antiporter NhaA [Maricaulis sp. MIT060901]|uniref:Na+/H+ antiporter NhaA n=1 Tax=Maricaulis sp. MIT060901 TaxID=3096993 RepID=UPI00399AB6D8